MAPITRRELLAMVPMLAVAGVAGAQGTRIQVYKDASCGCCSAWVTHLEKAGFVAAVTNSDDMGAVKDSYGVPAQLRSCHTGVVGGYAIEGHVPAADIRRLLKEKPAVVGLAVPGMPIGSPGMEVEGRPPQPYDVIAFDKGSTRRVFSSYNK